MAKTFTLKSNSYDGRYLQLTLTQTSNGSSANSSTIAWKLESLGGESDFYSTGATNVIINKTTVYTKARTSYKTQEFPASRGSVSGKITISHDNEGNLTIPVKLSTAIYTTTINEKSGNWTLDSIPRYATISQSVTSKTETTLNIKWTADSICDYLWYSIDDGSTYTGIDIEDAKEGNYTISSLEAGLNYRIRTKVRRKDSQLTSFTSSLSASTYYYPYCSEAPSFIIGNELTLKLYNPLSRLVTVKFIGANGEVLSSDSTAMDTVTGYNSDTFVNKLYASIPNDSNGEYKIEVVYEGISNIRDNGNTYSINVEECRPTFNNFSYRDSNTVVTNVTGNDQVLVKGLSNVEITVRSTDKMVATKSASPNRYIATLEGSSANAQYSDNDVIFNVGTPTGTGTKRLTVVAYDTRNVDKSVYKDVTVLDYVKPTVNVEASRLNKFEDTTTIKINGTYDKLTVDGVDKNSITAVEYRYRETDGEWSNWTSAKATLSNGKYTCTDVVISLNNGKAFNIEVRATDKLDSNIGTDSVDVGVSIFFVSTNMKACYINNQKIIMYDVVKEW